MKKLLVLTLLVFTVSSSLCADWMNELVQLTETAAEPMIADLGIAISGGVIQESAKLDFPGIKLGITASLTRVSDDNILISTGNIMIPWAAVSLGLPKNITVFARGFNYAAADADTELRLLGFGVKYDIINGGSLSPTPLVSVFIAQNSISATVNTPGSSLDISVNTISIGCAISKNLPMIAPFAGISYNITNSSIETATGSIEPSSSSLRFGAGVDLKPIPFTYLIASLEYANSNLNTAFGFGLKLSI